MNELFIEILSEEIPARMQESVSAEFARSVAAAISSNFAGEVAVKHFAGPRRIGCVVSGFGSMTVAEEEEIRGPKVGAPEVALEGFLKKNNLEKSALYTQGDYYYAKIGAKISSDPKQACAQLVHAAIAGLTWPKSMIDGASQIRWVRPMKSIIALMNGEVLPLDYMGVKAGNFTRGHRFMGQQNLVVANYADYLQKLAAEKVVLTAEERKSSIHAQINKLLPSGIKLIQDDALLNEVAGLVEYPHVLLAEIGDEFMHLPRELLIITLRHHQRYLMTEETSGKLAKFYFIVSNIIPNDGGASIVSGNGKVLSARLSDAKFFYDTDLETNILENYDALKALTFHAQIGSVQQKQEAAATLASSLAPLFGVDATLATQAVKLAKCDLVTNMVREFPELQGIMGYYYHVAQGGNPEVAAAARDHYKPQGPNDSIPESKLGACVAVADKLGVLNAMFGIGIKPTGSKDPYALRRAALGIIRIAKENAIDLQAILGHAHAEVAEFIRERN